MPLNRTLWAALWDRAAREEIGISIRFVDGRSAYNRLCATRPPGFDNYTVAHTPDPSALLIIRPGVTLNDESDAHAARQIYSDLE